VEFRRSGVEQRELGVTADEGAVWRHVSILAHPRGNWIHRRIHETQLAESEGFQLFDPFEWHKDR